MRGVLAFALALICVVGLGLPTGQASAQDRARATPVLDRPVERSSSVLFKGHARPRSVVRLQVRTPSRWATVSGTRATRRGVYRIAVRYPATTRRYRVLSAGRASVVRRVAPRKVATPAPPPTDECGVRPRRADGSYYACTFLDHFSGTTLDPGKWMGNPVAGHSDLCFADDPATIAVADGVLRLSARAADGDLCPERADGTRAAYAGGWVTSYRRWSQQYGRFEARIRVQDSSVQGLHEAFWLWPDTRYASDKEWPATGEIDIMETYSAHPDLAVPFLHYNADDNGGPVPGLNTAWNCVAARGAWNTYALDWTATRLTVSINGKTCLVNTAGAASFQKRFIINLTQFLGGGTNLFDGRAELPATMEVDYVKAWQ